MPSTTDSHIAADRPLLWLAGATLLAAALLLQTAACGSIDESGGEATATYRLQSLDQSCKGAAELTGARLLEQIDDPYVAPLTFPERQRRSTARLTVSYAGGALTCIPGHQGDPPGAPRLEIEVELKLRTDDGTLGQTIPGTISVLAGSDQVRFLGSAPIDGGGPEGASKLLLEGWLATEADSSQGAFRLVDSQGNAPDYHTVATWNTTRPVE